jgi:IS605 OrfB family transposase
MKLTIGLKLQPTSGQADALLATLERANAAANRLSELAWREQTFRQYDLHNLGYYAVKAEFDLTAQMVVRLIAKVADAYKLDRKRQRGFRSHGAIAYDDRIVTFKPDSVSLWTVAGRQRIRFVCGERQRQLLAVRQGESDLVYRDEQWFLFCTVNVEEPPPGEPDDWLGVDLGIVNIAADSDGTLYAGAHLNGLRRRYHRLRRKLQRKGTASAKRFLKRRRLKERRMATAFNHRISKQIVRTAEGTRRGIVLEDLKGIRDRVTVRQPQRRTFHSWSFFQLRAFIEYKARLVGVPVVSVDPRNTSRTCPTCGCIDKANRPAQDRFLCVSCGFAGLPDRIAATNLRERGRADVTRPHAGVG